MFDATVVVLLQSLSPEILSAILFRYCMVDSTYIHMASIAHYLHRPQKVTRNCVGLSVLPSRSLVTGRTFRVCYHLSIESSQKLCAEIEVK